MFFLLVRLVNVNFEMLCAIQISFRQNQIANEAIQFSETHQFQQHDLGQIKLSQTFVL